MTNKNDVKKDLVPTNSRAQLQPKEKIVSRTIRRVRDYLDETQGGLRRTIDKVGLHGELYETTTKTMESLRRLQDTEKRMEREDDQAALDHTLEMERKLLAIQKLQDERGRLPLENDHIITRVQEQINTLKNKSIPQQTVETDQIDSVVQKAQEMISQIEQRERVFYEVEKAKKQYFANLDEEVARGELSQEDADLRKEWMEEQVKLKLMEP